MYKLRYKRAPSHTLAVDKWPADDFYAVFEVTLDFWKAVNALCNVASYRCQQVCLHSAKSIR